VVLDLGLHTETSPIFRKFAFFKGLNQAAVGGFLTAEVTAGLPAGEYRIASINSAANHQPALSAVAQRGSNDDISYVSPVSYTKNVPINPRSLNKFTVE
jgi:hypothetical protein